ncbi:MAG: transcription termination/antitermination protein NusA, partial [Deltaproteobacteria bacterium]|nr:transcription termination/antitermination protein NusA [Deltaproteobacteria bacterium]
AILYRREQIPNERYVNGDHIRVILLDVLNDPREPSQLVISRASPQLLTKLFEMEVPEIYDGVVEIVTAAREPGRRAKIAVRSNDPDVDPVGACVGLRGSRVQAIISELRGEKIDIIHFSEDLPTYVANSLAPAELNRIKIKQEEREIDVEVEPDQLSLAIGRQGQNVRLASKLLGYKINISSTGEGAPSLEEQIRQRLLASQAEMGLASVQAAESGAEASAPQTLEPGAEQPAPESQLPHGGATSEPEGGSAPETAPAGKESGSEGGVTPHTASAPEE